MQRKKKRTASPTSNLTTNPPPPPPPRGFFVVRIFWIDNDKIVSELFKADERRFISVIGSSSVVVPRLTRTRIHRIVFFDTDITGTETPLLVLDVHPGSKLEIDGDDLTIDASVLTPFAAIGNRLALQAQIEIKRVGPVFKSFFARNKAGVAATDLMSNVSGDTPNRLKRLLDPATQIPSLKHSLRTGPFAGFNPEFLKFITGISIPNFAPPSCSSDSSQETKFSFIPLPGKGRREATVKTLQLTLKSGDNTKCPPAPDSGRIRTFWGPDEDKEGFKYSRASAPSEWEFSQRPTKEIDIKEPKLVGALPRARWVLTAFGVPTKPALDTWSRMVEEFQLSISRSRAGHGVSFFPEFNSLGNGAETFGRWAIAYELTDSNSSNNLDFTNSDEPPDPNTITIKPLSLQLWQRMTTNGSLGGVLHRIRNVDNLELQTANFNLTTLVQTDLEISLEKNKGMRVEFDKAVTVTPEDGMRPLVRMGSLDIKFAPTPASGAPKPVGTNKSFLSLRPRGEAIDADSLYQISIEEVSPGGQDYAVSEEFEAAEQDDVRPCVRPKPPVIIPLAPPSSSSPILLLEVKEKLTELTGHHQIVLDILSQTGGATRDPDLDICAAADRAVVVLDRNPFLVAEVKYLSFDRVTPFNSNTIATWNSDDGIAGAWQLQFEERPFCLVLPPQAVGEEMIKDRNQTVDPSKALPFNFGPATTMELNPRRVRTDLAETPWNLRRILAMQAQSQQGPVVKSIHYELLYGLAANAQNPAIRLADTFSQAGRIMSLPRNEPVWPSTSKQQSFYREYRKNWGLLYNRLLSRLAVLVPWDELLPSSDRKPLVLSASVSSRLRLPPASHMKRPVDVLPPDPIAEQYGTLRGGATWGFESKNIYKAVIEDPEASSSRLENFAFSPLGGWGKQEAGFQGDLTKVSAEVAMGRAFHYQVERLGRIACTWHLAKHVIVYERSVIPSRQFSNTAQPLTGWPVVRKFEEYVQLLEPKKSFPDDPDLERERRSTEAKQSRGFLDSCEFKPGARFNVNGAWGSDVSDFGWKIPLWRVGAQPEDIYPEPKVSFGLDSNQGEQQKVHQCELGNPENLYFFTLTRDPKDPTKKKKPDPDPRKWDPCIDVDFVNAPRPKARTNDFQGGDPRALSPADPAVPPLYGPCTFRLVPSAVPADLVSQRAVKPMAAVIDTITIVRSVATNDANLKWPPKAIAEVNSLHEHIETIFREKLLGLLPLDADPTLDLASSIIAKIQQDTDFATKFADAKRNVSALATELVQRIKDEEKRIGDAIKARLKELANAAAGELVETVKEYLDRLAAHPEEPFDAQRAVRILLETQHRVEEIILLNSSLPGVVPELISRYVDLVVSLRSILDSELTRINEKLGARLVEVRAAAAEVAAVIERARRIAKAFETAGLTPPLPFVPDPGPVVRARLKTYFDGLEDTGQKLIDEIRVATSPEAAQTAINNFKGKAYYRALQDLTQLKAFIMEAFGVDIDLTKPANEIAAQIDRAVHLAQQWQVETLEVWRRTVQDAAALIHTSKSELERARDSLMGWLQRESAGLSRRLEELNTEITSRIQKAADLVAQSLNVAGDLLKWERGVRDNLLAILNVPEAELKNVKKNLEKYRDELAEQAGIYLEQAARMVKDSPEFQTADKTLRLIRAFGEAPRVPKLDFDRPKVAYFYNELVKHVDLTPAVALVSQAADIAEKLKPLGVRLPTKQTLEQLLPVALKDFDVSRIFPSFAGIDLSNFLAGKKLPDIGGDNVQITQGIDPQTRRAYVRAEVKFPLPGASTLFAIGPLTLQIVDADFRATSEVSTDINGKLSKKLSGRITADWLLTVSNITIIKFRQTELRFDDNNGVRFAINPKNIELPEVMAFLSELMSITGEDGTGLTIGLLPDGVQCILSLPLPDTQAGTSGVTNLHLLVMMALRFDPFRISLGMGLSRKEAPFALTVFILGGGGFMEAWVTYTPSTKRLSCTAEVGIAVSASVAIALGPIKGGVSVHFGITALFQSGIGLSFGVFYVIRGQVSVLGLVSVCVTLLLEARYNPATKTLVGRGRFIIKIKICWCFTLEIDREVTYTLGSSGGGERAHASLAPRNGGELASANHAASPLEDEYMQAAREYVNMLV